MAVDLDGGEAGVGVAGVGAAGVGAAGVGAAGAGADVVPVEGVGDPTAVDGEGVDAPADGVGAPTAVDGTPLTAKAVQRRHAVLQVAIELATEGGYDAVHMREVAERADVALATVYRYFESKDHLLSAAVGEWAGQLQSRLARSPAAGDSPEEKLVDVLRRGSRAIERRPLLTAAIVRALASSDPSVSVAAHQVQEQIREMAAPILAHLTPAEVEGIVAVLAHVWNSSLTVWAHGRAPIASIGDELERAARILLRGV